MKARSKMHSTRSALRGFSLMEMVIVMGIIALILGGAMKMMGGIGDAAKLQKVDGDLLAISAALDTYKLNAGNYPTSQQGIKALNEKPSTAPVPKRWTQLMSSMPKDPWNNDYIYRQNGKKMENKFEIVCNGPDGKPETEDDMSSQDEK